MNFAIHGNMFPVAQIESLLADVNLTCEVVTGGGRQYGRFTASKFF